MKSRKNGRGSAGPLKTQVTLLSTGSIRIEITDAPADTSALVTRNMPLVRRIAYQMIGRLPAQVRFEDLISAGYEGLLEAVGKYDPGLGADFESYATHRIRGAIRDELRALDPLGRDRRACARQLDMVTRRLAQHLGREPEHAEIADAMGMTVAALGELFLAKSGAVTASLDTLLQGNKVHPPVAQDAQSPHSIAEARELRARMTTAIAKLPSRPRAVLGFYYYRDWNLREIGDILGVTESRACQIHTEGIKALRRILSPDKQEVQHGEPRG